MEERIRRIDLESWDRREAYELFRGFGFPYFSVTADVDVTALTRMSRDVRGRFSVALIYLLARAANGIPEFRQRICDGDVIEYPVVDPATTILGPRDQFRFCTFDYDPDFAAFAARAEAKIAEAEASESLWCEADRDNLLFMTSIPWISFSAFVHPAPTHAPDSVPRIAWGKYAQREGRVAMPLNVQAHHALVDGIHVGRFYEIVERMLADAPHYLSKADSG